MKVLSQQDIFQQNIGRTGPQFPGSPLSKAPLTTSQNSGRPPGKKKGPKPKEVLGALGPPAAKKKNQKGLLKAETGELDLLEIHTKHTLKKFQPGKCKNKNKVLCLQVSLMLFLWFSPGIYCDVCPISVAGAALRRVGREVE